MARDRGILIYIKAILNQFGEVLQHVRGILTKMGGTLYRRVRFFLGGQGPCADARGPREGPLCGYAGMQGGSKEEWRLEAMR